MKKALLLGAALMFIASGVTAQQLALYGDEGMSTYYKLDAMGTIAYVYLFANPDADGLSCVELSTAIEGTGFMLFAPTYHPDVVDPIMGGFPNANLGACFGACHEGWTWVVNAGIFVQTVEPLTITIGIFPGSPYPKVLNCLGDELEATPITIFGINWEPIAVEESSWGAIKNLYE